MKHRKTWTSWRRWALPLTALALGACDGRSVLGSSDGALIDLGGADIAPSPTAPPSDRDHDGVLVEGHTDSQGNPDHNMDLSQRRAASVVRWLSAHGVEAERLASSGLGQTRPLRSNITARNRAMNRRVEFHVLDPAPVPTPAAPTAPGRARRRR